MFGMGRPAQPAMVEADSATEYGRLVNVVNSAKATVDELLTVVRQEQSRATGVLLDELLDLRDILTQGVPDA
jgi:hypothetical protein